MARVAAQRERAAHGAVTAIPMGLQVREVDRVGAVGEAAVHGDGPGRVDPLDGDAHHPPGAVGLHPGGAARVRPGPGEVPDPGHAARRALDVQLQLATADEPATLGVSDVEVPEEMEVVDDVWLGWP